MLKQLSFSFILLATAACTQAPAEIALRGNEEFKRGMNYGALSPAAGGTRAASSYTVNNPVHDNAGMAPVSQNTVNSVRVDSVSVSDLPPPSAAPKADTIPPADERSENKAMELKEDKREVVETAPPVDARPVQAASKEGFIWPVDGKVISAFGPTGKGKANDGIGIAAASGEPVYAAADGEVVYVGDKVKGYGNMVLIKHEKGRTTTYAHLNRAAVARYDRVSQGDIIGYVGSTGNVKQAQLYFAVREGSKAVDPKKYLPSSFAAK